MSRMRELLASMRRSIRAKERGASLVEYALLIGLIALVCVGAVTYFGQETGAALDDTAVAVRDANPNN
jgi:Flp pilus assembly pilin Flp